MSLFPDARKCGSCGRPMEVHVDCHCSVCGWKPGDPVRVVREVDPKTLLDRMMKEGGELKSEDSQGG